MRIRLDLPNVTSLTIVTYNTRNYQNGLVPVVVPFICHPYGVTLYALIHPESARGKGLVNVHFSVAMHHVHRYVQSTGWDVCIPKALCSALEWEDRIVTSTAELVRISRVGPHIQPWLCSMAKKPRPKANLRRVVEVVYRPDGAENFSTSVYAYIGRQ